MRKASVVRVSASALLLLTLVLQAGFAPRAQAKSQNKTNGLEKIARSVTIYRDKWGVPHVYGPTDANVVFGFMYAQAEDNFWQIEDSYIRALGRASDVYGEQSLNADLTNRALEIVKLSQAEYPKLSKQMQEICQATADGLNYFLGRVGEWESGRVGDDVIRLAETGRRQRSGNGMAGLPFDGRTAADF